MTTTKRPYIQKEIAELKVQFDLKRDDLQFLSVLIEIEELGERNTQRARDPKARAVVAASTVKKNQLGTTSSPANNNVPSSTAAKGKATELNDGTLSSEQYSVASSAERAASQTKSTVSPPSVHNKPIDILSAWTAIEVLSPPSFRRPEDLAGGDRSRIFKLNGHSMPWENGGEKSRQNQRLYYQIILGSIDMEAAISALLKVYTDSREERPQSKGEAVLATIMVDQEGRLIDEYPVAISSFGWGVPVALAGNLHELKRWSQVEKSLVNGLTEKIIAGDDGGYQEPLTGKDLSRAYEWLINKLGLGRELTRSPSLIIRTYQYYKLEDPPESILLNSFFLDDLALTGTQAQDDTLSTNLQRYLGVLKPKKRHNLMSDLEALASALEPKKFPVGSWPANGRHPLVMLQQCAVNLASHDLKSDGILAVNGPPGTGKTTLLRDVIAAAVTERAKMMCRYDNPEEAFTYSGQKLKRGNAFVHLYRLDNDLKGFEIIVASSNNKAVENVSAEVPGIEAIADDADKLRYFQAVSDNLLDRKTWGTIAAVLGNAKNRSDFRQKFWWDEEFGFQYYLRQCSGNPQLITEKTVTGTHQRPRRIILDEKPPEDHDEALRRWRSAKQKFRSALSAIEKALAALQEAYELQISMRQRQEAIAVLSRNIDATESQLREVEETQKLAASCCDGMQGAVARIEQERDLSLQIKPGFWRRIFHRSEYSLWHEAHNDILSRLNAASKEWEQSKAALDERQAEHTSTSKGLDDLLQQKSEQASILKEELSIYNTIAQQYPGTFLTGDFFRLPHREKQTAAPWLDKAVARLRHDLFEAAIAVHRAFIGAAAKPIRHNLNILMEDFGMRSLGSLNQDELIPDLWATLFLVVPAVSTTFASVSRMFSRIDPETFGWLLIDEAGQVLPQAAIGALMRTRKAVVVGDPIQIEPVVALPDQLTEAMCKQFGVDPLVYNPPAASAQTLADSATAYFGTFESRYGTREVGVPLLVHRRCSDPMFSISNSVAYENLMVQAKVQKPSAIRDALGQSRWIDVQGHGNDKWCPEEGNVVIDLLRQIKSAGCSADLYIVAPFVVVQDRMRDLVKSSGILEGWVKDPYIWLYERIGTVHIVQGREAEAVFFVLGAPNPAQHGARFWAGGKPNLLNVATTRAKEALYVVGNRNLWQSAGVFQVLHKMLA